MESLTKKAVTCGGTDLGWVSRRWAGRSSKKAQSRSPVVESPAHSLDFMLRNLPLHLKETMNQLSPKRELNSAQTRPLKQEAGDSPCGYHKGTDL